MTLKKPLAVLLFAGVLAAGCDSFGPSQTVTPSITGCVLAADTQQPLAGVKVIRVLAGQGVNTGAPAYGAELLSQDRPVITGADGVYEVAGQSYATLFRHGGGWSVRLAFQLPGYAPVETNYLAHNFTNQTAEAASVVNVGNVSLRPLAK